MKFVLLVFLISKSVLSFSQENTNLIPVAPTNNEVVFEVNLSNIQLGKPFEVSYKMPRSIMQILEIGTNIVALGDTDIEVSNLSPTSIDLSVRTYALQSYPMPSLLITALDLNSNTNIFYTPSFLIPITNDLISNTNITLADIEPIYYVWNHLWTILLLLFLLVILGVVLATQYYKPKEKVMEEKPIDPYILAKDKLDKLEKQKDTLTEESYKEFFVELSETIREFLSYTKIPLALEMPTREVVQMMKEQKTDEDLQENITFLLRSTDRAKYAKQIFSSDRIEEVIIESYKMVKMIKRQEDKENADELRKS